MATDGFSEIHKNCMTTQMVEVLSTSKPGWRQDQQRPRVVHPQTPQVETERNAHYSSRASSPNYAQYSSDAWIRFGAAGEAPRGRGAPRVASQSTSSNQRPLLGLELLASWKSRKM